MKRRGKLVVFALLASAFTATTIVLASIAGSMPAELTPIPIAVTTRSTVTGSEAGDVISSEYSYGISEIEVRFYFDAGRAYDGICFGSVRDRDIHVDLLFKTTSGAIGNIRAGWGHSCNWSWAGSSYLEGNLAGTWSPGEFLVGNETYIINGRAPVVWPDECSAGYIATCFVFLTCQAAGDNPFSVLLLASDVEDIVPSGKDSMTTATVIALISTITFVSISALYYHYKRPHE